MKFMKRPESQLALRSFHKFSSELLHMLYLPEEDFLNISKGVILRKNQIVHISDEGLYTMTDGAVFQGRKRNLSQHKQIRKALGLNVQNYSEVSENSSLQLFDSCSIKRQ